MNTYTRAAEYSVCALNALISTRSSCDQHQISNTLCIRIFAQMRTVSSLRSMRLSFIYLRSIFHTCNILLYIVCFIVKKPRQHFYFDAYSYCVLWFYIHFVHYLLCIKFNTSILISQLHAWRERVAFVIDDSELASNSTHF